MRRVSFPLALSAVLADLIATTSSVRSAEAPPELGTDLMQAIEASNKSLSSNISLRDGKVSAADARDNQAFIQVEVHFAARPDAHDAMELARKTRELTEQIARQGGGNFDAAAYSATALSRTCRTCLTFYKKS